NHAVRLFLNGTLQGRVAVHKQHPLFLSCARCTASACCCVRSLAKLRSLYGTSVGEVPIM
ncbi:unnamed protein product, partial [Staurois parvus]